MGPPKRGEANRSGLVQTPAPGKITIFDGGPHGVGITAANKRRRTIRHKEDKHKEGGEGKQSAREETKRKAGEEVGMITNHFVS